MVGTTISHYKIMEIGERGMDSELTHKVKRTRLFLCRPLTLL